MSANLQKWNVSIVKSFIDYCESKVESQAIEELRTYLDEWQKTDTKPVASDFTVTPVRNCTKKRTMPEEGCRCMARVWRDSVSGVGGRGNHRCTRSRNTDLHPHLCTVHAKDVNLFGDDLRSSGMKDWAKRPSKEVNGKTVKAKSWFGWFIDPTTGKQTKRTSLNKAGEIAVKWDDEVYARNSRKKATKKSRKVCLINASSDDESSDSSQEKQVTKKKGRGRPKKTDASTTNDSSEEKPVTKKKGRGRPKKTVASTTNDSSEEKPVINKKVAENTNDSSEEKVVINKKVAENTNESIHEDVIASSSDDETNDESQKESVKTSVDKSVMKNKVMEIEVTKEDVSKLFDEDINSESTDDGDESSEEELEVFEFTHEGTEYFALKDGTLLDESALDEGEEKVIGRITGSFTVNEDDEIEKGENFAVKLKGKKTKKKTKKIKKSQ